MTKTAFITGSTAGIGKATASALASMQWHVLVHGRDETKCQDVVNELKQTTQNPKIEYLCADLSDLNEVRKMAAEVKRRLPQINVLVNNAGTFSHTPNISPDHLELTWVVNYLSRFLLTHLLLDTLKQNAPSRIVDVSGAYHAKGKIHFDDINLVKNYSMAVANSQSKLANVLFTYKLSRDLEGTQVTLNTLHPGAVYSTSVLRAEGFSSFSKWMYRLMRPFLKTPEQGAETAVFLAQSKEVEGVSGKYFVHKKPRRSSKASYDKALQEKLWDFSSDLLFQSLGIQI
jgi:NAD(P)-dependent dehydrogenase (short-subunit alcohol dehydrogenase family)